MPKSFVDVALRPVSAQVTLADSFHTSPIPVHKALRRLGAEGTGELLDEACAAR